MTPLPESAPLASPPPGTGSPLGVPSHLFRGPPEAVAEAVRHNGLGCVQLTPNFPDLPFHHPGQFSRDRCRQAADPFLARGIRIACLTGSSDLLDPDLDRRHRGVLRLHALLRHGREFGTDHVVAETGGAGGEAARAELRLIVAEALRVAADAGVRLLLKPAATQALASA